MKGSVRRIGYVEFLDAFSRVAEEQLRETEDYSDNGKWTLRMCGARDQPGLIHCLAESLRSKCIPDLEPRSQWYTLDAALISYGQESGFPLGYPPYFHCIIEHENGDHWHEEMWKLVHWRCPLKVLIVYDYNDDKKTSQGRQEWVDKRIQTMRNFLDTANALQGEECADYLLIVGSKVTTNEHSISWRACLLNRPDDAPRPIQDVISGL